MTPLQRLLSTSFLLTLATTAHAADLAVNVEGITAGAPIPAAHAVCLPTPDGKSNASGLNLRPTIRWNDAPEGTDSFAIFIMDPDVPADFTDAGKEGKIIAKDAKRQDFYHYGVVNIPAHINEFPGTHVKTKLGYTPIELVNDMGLNQYVPTPTAYGGPCPPWNDARLHHYHFIVLALAKGAPITAPTLAKDSPAAESPNTAKNTLDRLLTGKHLLAKGTLIGTYTLNPAAKP